MRGGFRFRSLHVASNYPNSRMSNYWFSCLLRYISKSFHRLPVTMDSSCAKTPSNGQSDRTPHGLVSSNQRASRRNVIMACQKTRASSYYGTCPFKFTISHNSVNSNSITSTLGLNDGKICPRYVNANALFLPKELTKSHSIPDLDTGCVLPHWISHFCTEASRNGRICQLQRASV